MTLYHNSTHPSSKSYISIFLIIVKEDLNDFATRLISDSFKKCSSKYKCLDILVPKDALNVARACLEELRNFTAQEKKHFMIAKVMSLILLSTFNLYCNKRLQDA